MKPAATLSLVVIAVLATVVVEETRIRNLRIELEDLRSLRAAEVDAMAEPPAPEVAASRQLPPDFPEPTDEQIQALATSDRADLYLDLGLNSTEQVYVDGLISGLRMQQQELAAAWLAAPVGERMAYETRMREAEEETDTALREFFQNEDDLAALRAGLSMQPDRDLYRQLAPYLSVQGATLTKTKEARFIEALHQIRMTIGGMDWNSPEALPFHATGTAPERFEEEWKKIDDGLKKVLPVFLEPREVEAIAAARKELFDAWMATLAPEDPATEAPAEDPDDAPAEEE